MGTRLKDRIAIITGASSGLGKGIALTFAASGARIVCADLKSVGVEQEITAKHGENTAIFVKCDVTKEGEIQHLIQEAVRFGGRLDIICNFAGVAKETNPQKRNLRAHEASTEDFDLTLAVNTRGLFLCCKYALEQMMKQEPREPNWRGERTRGWIVNCSSVGGLRGLPFQTEYIASKHAVIGLTKALALDYAQNKIHVNAICPGFVATGMTAPGESVGSDEFSERIKSLHPWREVGYAEDMANGALFLCSDESAWITGHPLVVDGGYLAG
ncbi:hypothetical protein FPOAC2_07440 [Fusarium poae]|uniref:Uncharacterized protein n=1 Tax=Fusarium poae TaxID=36050 RepID=A0A1B8A8U9_FUSPO|nr:hypothetical protein FPOA_12535 [Fusarium poae]